MENQPYLDVFLYLQITCVHICISPNPNYTIPIPHTCHGVLNFSEKSKFLPLLWQFLIDEKWYSPHKYSEDLGHEIKKLKNKKKLRKNDPKVWIGKIKTKTWFVCFFKCLLNFTAHALQSELNKVSISNFVKLQLQSMSSKIEQAFKKQTIFSIKMGPKRTSIRYLYGP